MEKYYTPKIEEFYVGFEYLETYYSYEPYECKILVPKKISEYYFSSEGMYLGAKNTFDDILDGIKTDTIKVKYLDQQDIESLGWKKKDNLKEPFTYRISYGIYYAYLHFFINIKETPTVVIDSGSGSFSLNVKNKSDLRKLMQQLHIEVE